MFQYLEKLRRKPEGERRKSVLLISLTVTLIIALIWIVGLSLRIDSTDFSLAPKEEKKAAPSIRETFSGFMDQVGDIIGGETASESQ